MTHIFKVIWYWMNHASDLLDISTLKTKPPVSATLPGEDVNVFNPDIKEQICDGYFTDLLQQAGARVPGGQL